MKKYFKELYVKFMVWQKYKALSPNHKVTENEIICTSICRKLINDPTSKFLIAPLSYKRYIKNDKLNIFVILDDNQISVSNHIYHYDVTITQRAKDKLCTLYDSKVEKLRQEYEDEIKSQIVHSLSSILQKINKEL